MQISSFAPVAARDSSNKGTSSAQGVDQTFLQLLATQLKYQSPLDPVDPNQLTSQLVQFNMLDQLSQIREILQTGLAPASGKSSSTQGAH